MEDIAFFALSEEVCLLENFLQSSSQIWSDSVDTETYSK